jgi:hypothetical protein
VRGTAGDGDRGRGAVVVVVVVALAPGVRYVGVGGVGGGVWS